jgi:hypothetical protein
MQEIGEAGEVLVRKNAPAKDPNVERFMVDKVTIAQCKTK